jgi:hypothetical protein
MVRGCVGRMFFQTEIFESYEKSTVSPALRFAALSSQHG